MRKAAFGEMQGIQTMLRPYRVGIRSQIRSDVRINRADLPQAHVLMTWRAVAACQRNEKRSVYAEAPECPDHFQQILAVLTPAGVINTPIAFALLPKDEIGRQVCIVEPADDCQN